MEHEDVLRIKSAMVIFSLEKELGELVKRHANPSSNITESGHAQKILKREGEKAGLLETLPVSSLVAASFLEEVIGLAVAALEDDTRAADMKKLQQIATSLDLYTVRNAVSHPNRSFPESYWYRAAALCSDPVIDRLDLANVRIALQQAVQGNLQPPPEEWMEARFSFVANNLPAELEHEMTGLLGRKDDFKKLQEILQNSRHSLAAVVAPGGVGKTALALELLKHVSSEPTSQEWVDGIIFCSLKQEALTSDGLVDLKASKTITELKQELTEHLCAVFPTLEVQEFSDICKELAKSRLLLCIDNLETLLRDRPQAFAEFYEGLPESWRVLVTSRVTVDGAKNLTLKPLNKECARALAVKYLEARAQKVSNAQLVEEIVASSQNNPLAIRLTIDRYAKGFPLAHAQSSAAADVVSFSYKNLIDTLSPTAQTILEFMFVAGAAQRSDLVSQLGLSEDDAAQAVADLAATSLVIRVEEADGEAIQISPSVRDLLLENPLDPDLRKRISAGLRDRKASMHRHINIQKSNRISRFSEYYIEPELQATLAECLIKGISLVRNKQASHRQSADMLKEMRKHYTAFSKQPKYLVWLARVFNKCGDENSAEQEFRNAASLQTQTLYPEVCYGEFLLFHHRYVEAAKVFLDLFHAGWHQPEKSDSYMSLRVLRGTLKTLAETKELDLLAKICAGPLANEDARHLQQVYQAQSFILEAAPWHKSDPGKSCDLLNKAAQILQSTPSSKAREVIRDYKAIVRYFFFESRHLVSICSDLELLREQLIPAWITMEPHFTVGFDEERPGKVSRTSLVAAFRAVEVNGNPFLERRWGVFVGEDDDLPLGAGEIVERGYKLATVTRVPETAEDVHRFIIAKRQDDGEPLFIHMSSCLNFDWLAWSKIETGHFLAYEREEEAQSPGKYPVARNVVLLDN
jgi:TPR repeat protein